jgi:uncharacterized protein YeaO (DUF488 family)
VTVHIVQLGTDRKRGEGLRIGTVRRPPRGVSKSEYAAQNWYDVWLPELSPSPELLKLGRAATTDQEWIAFVRKFRSEMSAPDKRHLLDLLAAMSQESSFSIGCYCEDESRCHRSVLRALLEARGAQVE